MTRTTIGLLTACAAAATGAVAQTPRVRHGFFVRSTIIDREAPGANDRARAADARRLRELGLDRRRG